MSEPLLYVASIAAAIGLMVVGLVMIGVALRLVPLDRVRLPAGRRRSRSRRGMAVPTTKSTRPGSEN